MTKEKHKIQTSVHKHKLETLDRATKKKRTPEIDTTTKLSFEDFK